jgi:hypothetical protein
LYLSICGIEDNWIFIVGQKTFKVTLSKVIKHEKTCFNYQHVFISFVFDTFGFVALDAANLPQKIQRVKHNNVVSPKSINITFKRIILPFRMGFGGAVYWPLIFHI